MKYNKAPWEEMFIHFLDDNGLADKQGEIIGENENHFKVQLFSVIDGCPSNIIYVKKDDIYDEKRYRIYDNINKWRDRFNKDFLIYLKNGAKKISD